jgi:hypothetical protein
MLRAFLVAEATAALTRGPLPAVPTLRGEAVRDIDNYLDRVWPSLTPQTFLVELCSSRRQLLAAGAGTLSEAELDMLALPTGTQVTSWSWSVDDVPLLDAADALLNGVAATYEHIVVDEAQDLSPLQLESIRRRSRAGSITVLGDLAQGTAPWAHSSWDPIVQALRHERVTAETVELDYGYRLPAEVHEVAMRLLPEAAPGMSCPQALRSSGHEIAAVQAAPADLVGAVVDAVHDLAADGIVGVITAASARPAVVAALDAAGVAWSSELRPSAAPVVVLGPDETKGLEFDSVVVAEPAAIVSETDHGLRSLFVALTRCTNRLTLVHARPLPAVLGLGADGETAARAEEEAPVPDPDRDEAADDAGDPTVAMAVPFPDDHPDEVAPGSALADRVVVSTPASAVDAVDAAVAALDDIDHDIARAVAAAIVDRLVRAVGPSLLPLVAEEIARALAVGEGRADRLPPAPANGSGHPVPDDAETPAR